MIPQRSSHRRETTIGLDWASDLILTDKAEPNTAELLILFAERLRQIAVDAQANEALSTTQIRLLMLLRHQRAGISPTMAAQELGRSLPVILDASSALLQLQLSAKVRVGHGARFLLQITDAGLSAAARLENWSNWLNKRLQSCDDGERMSLARIMGLLIGEDC
ncbi:MAG: hypothetical protein K2W86_01830 [Sphingomonas sp.]|uniref:hypothetical protein n=1 Tax=Sphingomonas sp. TaxID=28214 RepID=UPI0035A96B3C|nr:hypothetical protein [Sphingomonas sp.]